MEGSRSLASRAQGLDRLLGWSIAAEALLLALGLTLPIMTVERLLFLEDEISILGGCLALWRDGQLFLLAIILLFTVLFPIAKLSVALHLWLGPGADEPRLRRRLFWVEQLGRWAMLDVFVVALTVVAIEVSLVSDVELHAGLYVFTAAVILSMLTVQRIVHLARRTPAPPPNPPRAPQDG